MSKQENCQGNTRPEITSNFPFHLAKVYTFDDKGYDNPEWIPVRVYITPRELCEIIRLNVDLSCVIQDWLDDDLEAIDMMAKEAQK